MLKKDLGAFSRASLLLSNAITFYIMSIILFIIRLFEIEISHPIIFPLLIVPLFYLIDYKNKKHFIKSKRYSIVNERYKDKTKAEKRFISFISLIVYLSSIAIFIIMGIQLSRFYNTY